MREILLMAIVGVLAVVALVRPVTGLYAYTWFALMRPDILAWSYGDYPYSLVLAICTFIGTLRYAHQYSVLFRSPLLRLLYVFEIPLFISAVFAHVNSWGYYGLYLRVVLMTLLIPVLIDTAERLRTLIVVMALSLGGLGVKFGLYGLIHGGVRFAEGYGGMMTDNNDLGLAFSMTVPLLWYIRTGLPKAWMRTGVLVMMFLSMAAIVMTYSRGAAVTLGCILILIAFRSKHKLALLITLFLAAAPAIYLVRATYFDRLATIASPEHEASSYTRLALTQAALKMWMDYPWIGVGFGGRSFAGMVDQYTDVTAGSVAHNTYAQILVDSGIFAFLLYLSILLGTVVALGKAQRQLRDSDPELRRTLMAMQTSLLAFVIGSAFLSRIHFDVLYMLITACAAFYEIRRNQQVPSSEVTLNVAAEVPSAA